MANRHKCILILLNYLPLLTIITMGTSTYQVALKYGSVMAGSSLLLMIYLLPMLATRLIFAMFGRPEAKCALYSRDFFVWWFSLQMQSFYIRLPFIEEVLRFVPGLYSLWLRGWGAKVGKFVFWSGGVHILDRPFVKIGDQVIFGYGVGVSAHLWNQRKNQTEFIFAPVEIGAHSLIGAKVNITPGVHIGDRQVIPATTFIQPGKKIAASDAV